MERFATRAVATIRFGAEYKKEEVFRILNRELTDAFGDELWLEEVIVEEGEEL